MPKHMRCGYEVTRLQAQLLTLIFYHQIICIQLAFVLRPFVTQLFVSMPLANVHFFFMCALLPSV